MGTYPRSKGSILVTKDAYKNLIPTGHAAIVYSKDVVIEALAQGVVKGRNNWNMSKKTCYGAKVVAASTAKQQKAANWAYKQIGKKYNYNFTDINRSSIVPSWYGLRIAMRLLLIFVRKKLQGEPSILLI